MDYTHYRCPVCGAKIPRDAALFLNHAKEHIVELIKKEHPEWVSSDGICKNCLNYYEKQLLYS